jgi:hypothetical protein
VERRAVERLAELRLDGLDRDHEGLLPTVGEWSSASARSMMAPACRR